MNAKKRIKELKKQLRKDKNSRPVRLQLATLYRETNQPKEAVELFWGLAYEHYQQHQMPQARAMCHSVLELQPDHGKANELLRVVGLALRSKRASSEVDGGDWVPSLARPPSSSTGPTPSPQKPPNDSPPPVSLQAKRAPTPASKRVPTPASVKTQGHAPKNLAPKNLAPKNLAPKNLDDIEELPTAKSGTLSKRGVPYDSLMMSTPTPLPIPLSPHDADNQDSMAGIDMKRYKLGIKDPTGPVPLVSLPDELGPLDESGPQPSGTRDTTQPLAPTEDGGSFEDDDPDDDLPTRIGKHPKDRLRTIRGSDDPSFEDESTAQVPAVNPARSRRPRAARASTPERRLTTETSEPLHASEPIAEYGNDEDTSERSPLSNPFSAWAKPDQTDRGPAVGQQTIDEAPGETARFESAQTAEAAPQAIGDSDDRTVRVAMSEIAGFDLARFDVPPAVTELPARLDGLPMVIHDDIELGEAFTSNLTGAPAEDSVAPLAAFSDLPADVLDELAARMVLRHFARDEYLVTEDEPATTCLTLVTGQVSVSRRAEGPTPDGYETLCQLTAGALVGESSLLPGRRRWGSVHALEECTAYEIPRRVFRELAAIDAGVDPTLEQLYRERALDSLMSSHPFLRGLKKQRQQELRSRFQFVHARPGESVIREGEPSGGLYLVLIGELDVTKRLSRKRASLLTTVPEGGYVSDMSSLANSPSSATVAAAGSVELAVLPSADFRRVLHTAPELWSALCAEGGRRSLTRHHILTGRGLMV